MATAHMAPGNRFERAHHGFINYWRSRSSLFLQPRIISRRRRDGRRRGTRRRHRSPAAESHNSSDGTACIKSFHIVAPGTDAAEWAWPLLRNSLFIIAVSRQVNVTNGYGRICSGVSPGEPLPLASALLINATTRRDNGTCSPYRSAIAVMTP